MDVWISTNPIPLLKGVSPRAGYPKLSRHSLCASKDGNSTNILASLFQHLTALDAVSVRQVDPQEGSHLSACWHQPAWRSPCEGTLVCFSPRTRSAIPGGSFWPISVSSPVKVILNASIPIWCIFFSKYETNSETPTVCKQFRNYSLWDSTCEICRC